MIIAALLTGKVIQRAATHSSIRNKNADKFAEQTDIYENISKQNNINTWLRTYQTTNGPCPASKVTIRITLTATVLYKT